MRTISSICFAVVTMLWLSATADTAAAANHANHVQNENRGVQGLFPNAVKQAEARAEQTAAADDPYAILLNTGVLDTRTTASTEPVTAAVGKHLQMIHFSGPIQPAWHAALRDSGLRIVSYIPNNAYLVYGDSAALTRAKTADNIQWCCPYLDEYKVQPGARIETIDGAAVEPDTDWFTVQLVRDDEANAATLALLDREQTAPRQRFEINAALEVVNCTVRVPAKRLTVIAAQPDVISIHPYHAPKLHCERQGQIMAGNLTGDGSQPTGPGYLTWLLSNGFTQAQFTNSGFVVVVTDDGWDGGVAATPLNSEFRFANDAAQSSRVVFADIALGSSGITSPNGLDGHGNLNASIIGGYNNSAGLITNVDSSGYHYGLGIAPMVLLASTKIFTDGGLWSNPNEADTVSNQYRRGARLSSNSWGAPSGGAYDSDSQNYDRWVRDAEPGIAGNQEMAFIFSAGNNGSGANTIGTPGTAKNVFTIGATENVNEEGVADGCGISAANNANDIISFSSRGPCDDGRKKPDVVAPGTHVYGAASYAPGYNGSGVCNQYYPPGQTKYCWSSGTSHSTPAAAGAAALLRQWFINRGMAPPSPAMTKAVLMNGAQYLTGVSANDSLWSNSQGMGGVHLGRMFANVSRILRDQHASDLFTASGQQRVISSFIANPSLPTRVTLAWTDAPGPTTGNAYVNDLNLEVTINGSVVYKGNNFSGAFSASGGSNDPRNNVESVFLPAGTSGSLGITITAANIAGDGVPGNGVALDQDFALVVYNASTGMPEVITLPATNIGGSTATLLGTINANGQLAIYYFEYGETMAYGQTTPFTSAGNASTSATVSAAIGGLSERTLYHAQIVASNAVGRSYGGDIAFGTLGTPIKPDVQAYAADTVTTNAARFSGSVNPHGDATQWRFDYGTTPAFGLATAVSNAGAGYSAAAVAVAVSGLSPQTAYYYRLVAWNSAGTNMTATRALITAIPALMNEGFNLAVMPSGWITEIVSNTATPPTLTYIAASSYPSGFLPYEGARFLRFNSYSCTKGAAIRLKYTNSIAQVGGGKIDVNLARTQDSGFSANIDTINVQYSTNDTQWTSVATYTRPNPAGNAWHTETCPLPAEVLSAPQLFLGFLFTSAYGNDCHLDDVSVIAASGPPLVATDVGSAIDTTNACIAGLVNPNGRPSTYYFEYGLSTNYGTRTPDANAAAGTSTLPVSNIIGSLIVDMVYHYRIVATNAAGASAGADATVRTLSTMLDPLAPATLREHQVLLRQITGKTNVVEVLCNAAEVQGAQYFDTNTWMFSCVPALGTASSVWNVVFVGVGEFGMETQTLAITVEPATKKITAKTPLLFEDEDSDLLAIKYTGVKKIGSSVVFDGQNIVISNAYALGNLSFGIKQNKTTGDGTFDLRELGMDGDAKSVSLAGNVGTVEATGRRIETLKFTGKAGTVSNVWLGSAKTISAGKGSTIVGTIAASNGFEKLTGDSIQGARMLAGVPAEATVSNTPATAGFKTIKASMMHDSIVAGCDQVDGTKVAKPGISVKAALNSWFYHTDTNGTINTEKIIP